MPSAPIELSIEQQGLAGVAKVIKSEADGKFLRRELVRSLKAAADAPVARAQANMLATPSRGLRNGVSLRAEVSRSIKPTARLSGKSTGVTIRQSGTPNVRGFKMAGRRFNRGDFRRPVFGTDVYITQRGNKDWFDRPMQAAKPDFKADVVKVVQELADTLAARARVAARQ